MLESDVDLYRKITHIAREETLRNYNAKSCIVTTAAILNIAERLGLPVGVAVACRAIVFNPYVSARVDPGMSNKEIARLTNHPEGWSVMLGMGEENWEGHLVALIPDRNMCLLIDGSLDQATRPQHDIVVKPLIEAVPHSLEEIKQLPHNSWIGFSQSEHLILYRVNMQDNEFTKANYWKPKRYDVIVNACLSRLS